MSVKGQLIHSIVKKKLFKKNACLRLEEENTFDLWEAVIHQ